MEFLFIPALLFAVFAALAAPLVAGRLLGRGLAQTIRDVPIGHYVYFLVGFNIMVFGALFMSAVISDLATGTMSPKGATSTAVFWVSMAMAALGCFFASTKGRASAVAQPRPKMLLSNFKVIAIAVGLGIFVIAQLGGGGIIKAILEYSLDSPIVLLGVSAAGLGFIAYHLGKRRYSLNEALILGGLSVGGWLDLIVSWIGLAIAVGALITIMMKVRKVRVA